MSNTTNDMNVTRIGPDEPLITLAQAAELLPRIDQKKVPIGTIWRWCRRGLRGVCLEYVRVGRKICTTHVALLRFFTALSEIDRGAGRRAFTPSPSIPRKPISSRRRQKALAQADAVLARAGI